MAGGRDQACRADRRAGPSVAREQPAANVARAQGGARRDRGGVGISGGKDARPQPRHAGARGPPLIWQVHTALP
eukprot:4171079-Prymnesium_polylepis.1